MTVLLDRYCRTIVGKLGLSEQYTRLAVLWLLRGSLFLGMAAILFLLSTATIFEKHG